VNAFGDRSGRAFYAGLLEGLIRVMGMWHGYLFQHGPRVSVIALRLGRSFELDRQQLSELFFGAVLSDLGMIGLVEEALENPKPSLTEEARAQVKVHPKRGADTVSIIPYLGDVVPLVAHHHEWWDGTGYPHGLSGDAIPLCAQILRVADTVAALGEDRPQRLKLDAGEIRKEVQRGLGHEFSPEVGKRFIGLIERGDVHGFDEASFRQSMLKAVEHLLPAEVPGVSADQLLEIFAGLIDAKDPYTGGHSRRVAALGQAVAEKMGLDERVQDATRSAGYLHDVGKVSIPLRILTKPGRLDQDEYRAVKSHTEAGAHILEAIPSLQHLTTGARYHHERWDGKGYPEGLSEGRIPIVAQILAICDSYDAMTSGRAYRASKSHGHAMEEVDQSLGTYFAPGPTGAFLTLPYETFHRIKLSEEPRERDPAEPFTESFRPRVRSATRTALQEGCS